MKILIITPVRNEEKYLETTIRSMISQSLLPYKWIIVDDGSTDRTKDIILHYKKDNPFIHYIFNQNRGYRKPGTGVVEAFYAGYSLARGDDYDIVAKFDGDMEFPGDMLSTIVGYLALKPRLGIVGPVIYERSPDNKLKRLVINEGFVNGACKFYRRECFSDIDGLIKRSGWDGVDIIRANLHQWTTLEIPELQVIHLRSIGTAKGEGLKRAFIKYGDVSYYMGGYFWHFLLHAIYRAFKAKRFVLFHYMLKGYFHTMFAKMPKKEKRESPAFRNFLKKKQLDNFHYWISLSLKKMSAKK